MQQEQEKQAQSRPAGAPVKYLTLADIAAIDDREIVDVAVPEWKGTIPIQSLSADEALAFVRLNKTNPEEAIVRALAVSALQPDRRALLCQTPDDVKVIRSKRISVFRRLQDTFMKLNGFADADPVAVYKAFIEARGIGQEFEQFAAERERAAAKNV